MYSLNLTVIPPKRVSRGSNVEIRIAYKNAVEVLINIIQKGDVIKTFSYPLDTMKSVNRVFPAFDDSIKGDVCMVFEFYNSQNDLIAMEKYDYEFIESQCTSTALIDGCWISIYHWSEDEARWFNSDLKKLTDQAWKEQIYAMGKAGINSVIIQNVFHNNKYAGQHELTVKNYDGKAFYPSKMYMNKYTLVADDPLGAIFSAADEMNMKVFPGIGNFAWFDFSRESLDWHKAITDEIYTKYGHHPSLYGWYISEEIFGSLYYDYPPVSNECYSDIIHFFKEYKEFVSKFDPTMPIALAPGNIRFHEFESEWKEILENVDILLPFGFARDTENNNLNKIKDICNLSGTRFWVDMEMFVWPLDNGLVPKKCEDLIKEIRMYDSVEQIFGYQFTGLMNTPESKYDLGGFKSKQLYSEYCEYYQNIKKQNEVNRSK